ncbi:MAG TPA: MBL fold metallo-hydrolase [Methanospirillum sp.]|nr:MBL fold metallo-hydrolase [Methanospirillum sp.]
MKVINLTAKSVIYTSNAYYCIPDGSSPGHEGCGTLIDTGCDPLTLDELRSISKTCGEQPICRIIITHSHYDHSRILGLIRAEWSVQTFAYSAYVEGIDTIIKGGEQIPDLGITWEFIHVPGHSTDSVCVYCPEEEILFSGDTPLAIWGTEGTYELPFVRAFEELEKRPVRIIYPGHGDPITSDCNLILTRSLRNLRKSRLI